MKDSITSLNDYGPTHTSFYIADDNRDQAIGIPQEKRSIKYDALILDAQLRQSLVSIRSLGQRGMRVAAMEIADNVNTMH